MRALLAISTFAAATLCSPLRAEAQPDTPAAPAEADEQELTRIYEQAQEHFLAKRYTEALPLFRQVAEGLDSPNAMLYVARCLRETGRLVEAHRAMKLTVQRATERAETEVRFAQTRDAAAEELRDIEARVGRVSVFITAAPPGTTVEVNGERLAQLDEVVAVMPGSVHIAASAPGREPVRQLLDVAAGTLQTVALRFAEQPPPPPAAVPPAPYTATPPPQPAPLVTPDRAGESSWTNDGTIRLIGVFVTGLGVAGWTTLAVAGTLAERRFEDIEQQCAFQRCTDPALNDSIDEGRNYDTIANIGLTVGAVGTAVGALMIIFGGAGDSATGTVDGGSGPQGGWLSYRRCF